MGVLKPAEMRVFFIQMFTVYIIYSEKFDIYYIGQTGNLEDRLQRHNQDRSKYTKRKGPWKLVWSREFPTRAEAMAFEKELKRLKNRENLLKLIGE
ncbi:MAG: hypothetical protein Kow00108_04080 [Calditrichia bacterium]